MLNGGVPTVQQGTRCLSLITWDRLLDTRLVLDAANELTLEIESNPDLLDDISVNIKYRNVSVGMWEFLLLKKSSVD